MESLPQRVRSSQLEPHMELPSHLERRLGVFAAAMMGLGSIVGTGVFVSIAIAAGVAGPSVVLAILIAAVVATCNGLSSAQLAANHPVSGGTYEYGYRWLHPTLGFTAGWLFLCAKSASAATAGLGFSGYLINALRLETSTWLISVGVVATCLMTALVLGGIHRSSQANIVIVSITLTSLTVFILAGAPTVISQASENLAPFFAPAEQDRAPLAGFLEACALMFVAYTGYGRIATLGEEIREPKRNIPLAIGVALTVSLLLYMGVALVGVSAVGAGTFSAAAQKQAAPLEVVARTFAGSRLAWLMAVGAVTAMLGVLLNLLLGLSRVVLAMARRGDLPALFSRIDGASSTPRPAVILVAAMTIALVLFGNLKVTWSFSAFTVLIYYALTNLAALRLSEQERFYPRWISWLGLASCLFLAFWVDLRVVLIGLIVLAVGLAWHLRPRR